MRKILLMVMVALSLLFTQCKKSEVVSPVTPPETNQIIITLNVDGNSKAVVDPSTGKITFEVGDKVYVASNGKYVGTLECKSVSKKLIFQGTITDPKENDYLYLYFFGNKIPSEELTAGSTSTFTVNISDQNEKLPIISCGRSNVVYSSGTTAYSARLINKCALVKFSSDVTPKGHVSIKGLKNKVSVTLSPTGFGEYQYSEVDEGMVILNPSSTTTKEYWAILLPQEESIPASESTDGDVFFSNIGIGKFTKDIPAIGINDYITNPITLTMTNPGVLPGEFSVAADKKVRFSMGNLQYIGTGCSVAGEKTGPYWRFATNQWDRMGNGPSATSCPGNVDYITIPSGAAGYNKTYTNAASIGNTLTSCNDLFSYGARKLPETNTKNDQPQLACYRGLDGPYNNITPSDDWGINVIFNAGNVGNSGWRTMSKDEWEYVMFANNNVKCAAAQVHGVKGALFVPDSYVNKPNPEGVNIIFGILVDDTHGKRISVEKRFNELTDEQWNKLESLGFVFVPSCYYRHADGNLKSDTNDFAGNYWTGTIASDSGYIPYYFNTYCNPEYHDLIWYACAATRAYGFAVRLVKNIDQ